MQSDYQNYDAIGLAELVTSGAASERELLDAAIARTEAVNPALNAVVYKDYAAARARAGNGLQGGPLAGVPYLLKDLGPSMAGWPLTMGSRHYRHYAPGADDELVSRTKAAGLNIFGKTNTPELGIMPVTEPQLFGPCRNPWSLAHTPGGSSGGAAAAVAGGIVPLAHASDGGGSIRIPASCCGLFGLKPSRGRQPGTIAAPGDMVVDHALSRSVRDSALLLDLTSGNAALPPGALGTFLGAAREPCAPLTVAYVDHPMLARQLAPEVRDALAHAARLLETLGHRVEPVTLRGIDFDELSHAYLVLWSVSVKEGVLQAERITGRKPRRDEFELRTWTLARIGERIGVAQLPAALDVLQRSSTTMADFMARYDVMLSATLAGPPLKIGAQRPTPFEDLQLRAVNALPLDVLLRRVLAQAPQKTLSWAGCTELFNMTGQPAMSVPLYWSAQNLPIGVQFAARVGAEATLLRLAA